MLPGCRHGSLCGFGKLGLTSQAFAIARDWAPTVTAAWKKTRAHTQDPRDTGESAGMEAPVCTLVVAYTFPLEAQVKYGAPSIANITVTVAGSTPGAAPKGSAAPAASVTAPTEVGIDVQ